MKNKRLDFFYRLYPINTHKFNNFYYILPEYRNLVDYLCTQCDDEIQDAAITCLPFIESLSPEQFVTMCNIIRSDDIDKLILLIRCVNERRSR